MQARTHTFDTIVFWLPLYHTAAAFHLLRSLSFHHLLSIPFFRPLSFLFCMARSLLFSFVHALRYIHRRLGRWMGGKVRRAGATQRFHRGEA
ncbi:hypothetical protein IWX49DRAFT_566002, partial [Phyllosticta citricarpa]